MSLLVKIITVTILTSPIFAPAAFAEQNIPHDPSFRELSHPYPWTPRSEICFETSATGRDCAKVTDMGEIMLRQNGATADDVAKKYVDHLSPEARATVNKYHTLWVRYLSLDGEESGRYIVQINYTLLNVPGVHDITQAIYLYGNFKKSADAGANSVTLQPQGYGDIPSQGRYSWRTYGRSLTRVDAEALVNIAQTVVDTWVTSRLDVPQTPKP